MPMKCQNCGVRVIPRPISKLPLWEGDPLKSRFNWEALKPRNILWKNFIIGDPMILLIYISLILVAVSYMHDTQACREVMDNPCDFVETNMLYCTQQKPISDTLVNSNYINFSLVK